jgi:Sulfotransferase family
VTGQGDIEVEPIFILSLPRSGSTLLQRIIGSHDSVATASEPFLLLPLLYSLRETGVNAEYEHRVAAGGIRGFAQHYLTGGIDGYLDAVRRFALSLYADAAGGKEYFLDKTPRYHLIADELIRLFPSGRFIFLWRHPLAIAASMMELWGDGKWTLDGVSADFFRGVPALVDARLAHADRVTSVTYEELIGRPSETVERLLDYLELSHDPSLIKRFKDLERRNQTFWDPTGTRDYDSISAEPLTKWHHTMANPARKAWCRAYVRQLGSDRLATMGYDLDEILVEIDSLPSTTRFLGNDVARIAIGAVDRRLRERVVGVPFPLWRSRLPPLAMTEADRRSSST